MKDIVNIVNKHNKRIKLPLIKLNKLVGGIKSNEIIVIAARPGCGKTTLALNLIQGLNKQNIKCGLYSLEMNGEELASRIKNNKKKDLFLIEDDIKKANIECIREDIRDNNLKAVFIDYLQLMSGKIKQNSNALKQLSRETNTPIFVLAQLNRQAHDKTPQLNMLKDCGAIEQDADQVWFIQEESIIVAKNRKGATGEINTFFDKANFKIIERDYVEEELEYSKEEIDFCVNRYKDNLENKISSDKGEIDVGFRRIF